MQEVLSILIDCWKYDVEVYKHGWMYWPLLIPAMCYTAFFFAKWAVLTAPAWLPISIVLGSMKATLKGKGK